MGDEPIRRVASSGTLEPLEGFDVEVFELAFAAPTPSGLSLLHTVTR